jgi:hypothetical protein
MMIKRLGRMRRVRRVSRVYEVSGIKKGSRLNSVRRDRTRDDV